MGLLSRAEKIWDTIAKGPVQNFSEKPDNPKQIKVPSESIKAPSKIKVPQVREDIPQINGMNLKTWLRAEGQKIGAGVEKIEIILLAEELWDAKENGTLESLPIAVKSPTLRGQRTLTTPQTREDILRKSYQNLKKVGYTSRSDIKKRCENQGRDSTSG